MTDTQTISHDWLTNQKCIPCEGGTPIFTPEQIQQYIKHLKKPWQVLEDKKLQYTFQFLSFKEAIAFINRIAVIAEDQGHHPDMAIYYNKVVITLWTHAIGGLSENDFILAAKIEEIKTNEA